MPALAKPGIHHVHRSEPLRRPRTADGDWRNRRKRRRKTSCAASQSFAQPEPKGGIHVMSKTGLIRRDLFAAGGAGAAALVLGSLLGGQTSPAFAEGNFGPKKKLVFVPQAAGDWNIPIRAGQRDFCAMVGWDYQFLGNPVYSVENHAEQVNNAIAAKADVIVTE